jgi:hypothetical protein
VCLPAAHSTHLGGKQALALAASSIVANLQPSPCSQLRAGKGRQRKGLLGRQAAGSGGSGSGVRFQTGSWADSMRRSFFSTPGISGNIQGRQPLDAAVQRTHLGMPLPLLSGGWGSQELLQLDIPTHGSDHWCESIAPVEFRGVCCLCYAHSTAQHSRTCIH